MDSKLWIAISVGMTWTGFMTWVIWTIERDDGDADINTAEGQKSHTGQCCQCDCHNKSRTGVVAPAAR